MQRAPRIVVAVSLLTLTGAIVAWRGFGGDGLDPVFVSGTVESTEADLGFQVSGRLEQVAVREGDRVEAGAELALLDRADLLAQRAAAEAQVASASSLLAELVAGARKEEVARARAALSVAENRRDAAKRDVERLRGLAEQSLVSRQAFDHQQTDVDVAEGQVAKASEELRLLVAGNRPERIAAQRAELERATAALAQIDALLAQAVVRAPFTGTVTVRHREPGEAVSPGAPVLTLQDLGERWVRVYVPGDEVGRLALGQCAEIAADGYADRRYVGVVSHIADVAEFTPRNVQSTKDRVRLVYEVRVRVVGDETMDLKPGLPGDVTFAADTAAATTAGAACAPAAVARAK
jgi:HlyD family secretion protein